MYGYIQHNYYKGHIFLEGKFSIIVTKYSIKKKNFQGEKNQSTCFLEMKVTTSEGRFRKREKKAYAHTNFRDSKILA